jgi:hypothetical protein
MMTKIRIMVFNNDLPNVRWDAEASRNDPAVKMMVWTTLSAQLKGRGPKRSPGMDDKTQSVTSHATKPSQQRVIIRIMPASRFGWHAACLVTLTYSGGGPAGRD